MAAAVILKITQKSRYLRNGFTNFYEKFGTVMQNGSLNLSDR